MTANTKTALTAILAADGTIPPELGGFALKLLGAGRTPTPEDSAAILARLEGGDALAPVVRTKEAKRLFGVDVKTLRNWGKRGCLVPVYGGHSGWRIGYTRESVRALLAGRPVAVAQ